jgi:hypothetical protein
MSHDLSEWARKNCKNPRPISRKDGSKGTARCNSRDPRKCFYCSELNRLEMKILIGSGCNESAKFGVTSEMLAGFNIFWDTLTAPSFGRCHLVPATAKSPLRTCGCGDVHSATSPLKGVPIDRYDRRAAVEWNSKSSGLIEITFRKLKRRFPELEFAIVREYQARGSIHIHFLLRLPKTIPVEDAVAEINKLRLVKSNGITWGRQSSGAEVLGEQGSADAVRYMSKVVGYSAKAQGLYDRVSPERMRHYDLMSKHAKTLPHTSKCDPSNCLSTAHRNLGFKGHIFTMSDGWSLVGLNRKVLADQRREWVDNNRELLEARADEGSRHKRLDSFEHVTIAC